VCFRDLYYQEVGDRSSALVSGGSESRPWKDDAGGIEVGHFGDRRVSASKASRGVECRVGRGGIGHCSPDRDLLERQLPHRNGQNGLDVGH